jgi:CheY-like chemotaxis protein/HPt (histidine-containing phosphotransfer) domain-containing protein
MTDSALQSKSKPILKKPAPLHILLAQDNLLQIKLITILFAQYDISIEVVLNGREAVDKIKMHHFDLVLMDIQMPVMNGQEATALIRNELKNNIPIIALTANAKPGEKKKCLQLGMNDYVSKPIDADNLFNAIYRLTGKAVRTKSTKINAQTVTVASDKVCNLDYLMGATHGNKKAINNIVAVFFKETKKELILLNDAIEKTNYSVISDISHKIKSAFPILGISVLEPVFKEIELLSSSTSSINNINLLNQQVNQVFNQAENEMMLEN